jgi:hypothetical protein
MRQASNRTIFGELYHVARPAWDATVESALPNCKKVDRASKSEQDKNDSGYYF